MRRRKKIQSENGFSLLELVITITVMSVGLPAVVYAFCVAMTIDSDATSQAQAYFLANGLMNEISQRRFRESAALPGNGADTGEESSYDRRNFDDVDDYAIFAQSWGALTPPRDEAGTVLASYSKFSQHVEVSNIAAPGSGPTTRSLASQSAGTTDFKMVTVTISWQGGKRNVTLQKVFALP